MVEFYLLTFPRFPLRKKEHKYYFGKKRTHDFRTSRCAAYLLDHSGDELQTLKEEDMWYYLRSAGFASLGVTWYMIRKAHKYTTTTTVLQYFFVNAEEVIYVTGVVNLLLFQTHRKCVPAVYVQI